MNRKLLLLATFFSICVIAFGKGTITEREYWIDGKIVERTALGASPTVISLEGLLPGVHSYSMRAKDSKGLWSSVVTQYFIIIESKEEATIVRYMYWLDDDYENRVSGDLDAMSGILAISLNDIEEGMHTLNWCVANTNDVWSNVYTQEFNYTKGSATGIDNYELIPSTSAQKLFRNGQIYILTDDKTYIITGQELK